MLSSQTHQGKEVESGLGCREDTSIFSDSKSCLSGLNWPRSEKVCIFGTFLVGGGDIRYWMEMTSFWFVMVSLVTSNVGG